MKPKAKVHNPQEYALAADFWHDGDPAPLARRDNFVEEIRPAQAAPLPVDPYTVQAPVHAYTEARIVGTYSDRAKGYVIAVTPLSLVAGVLGVLVATIGLGVPFFSLGVLGWFFTWFGVVWLLGWLANLLISPDGNAFIGQVFLYRLLRHEQRERHNRYRGRE